MKTSPFWHEMAAMSMMSCLFVRDPQLIVASSFVHVVPMKDALLPLSGEIISSGPFGAADPVVPLTGLGGLALLLAGLQLKMVQQQLVKMLLIQTRCSLFLCALNERSIIICCFPL